MQRPHDTTGPSAEPLGRRAVLILLIAAAALAPAPARAQSSQPHATARQIGEGWVPRHLTAHDGALFFTFTTTAVGDEAWVTRGTPESTMLLADIYPGGTGAFAQFIYPPTVTPVLLDADFTPTPLGVFFAARDAANGCGLWITDGTPAGTRLVSGMMPGEYDIPTALAPAGGALVFHLSLATEDRSLWTSDGTPEGTTVLHDVQVATPLLAHDGAAGPEAFFGGAHAAEGDGLWATDATVGGTRLVAETRPGEVARPRLSHNRLVYFSVESGGANTSLQVTDGTPEGTTRLLALPAGDDGFDRLGWFGGGTRTAYFLLGGASDLIELWASEGSAETTRRVGTFERQGDITLAGATIGDVVYFNADDPGRGYELWRSDGTEAGTFPVADIYPGPIGSGPNWLTAGGGRVFFWAYIPSIGTELWSSDGTADGTWLEVELLPGFLGSSPQFLTFLDGRLFFSAHQEPTTRRLWILERGPIATGQMLR